MGGVFHFQNHFPLVTSWEWFSGEITCAVDSRNILRGRTYSVVPRQLPEVRGERSETSIMASHLWVSSGCLGRGAPESSQEEPWLMQVRPVLCHRSPETQQLCYPEDHIRDTAQNMFYHHIYILYCLGAHTSVHTPNFVVFWSPLCNYLPSIFVAWAVSTHGFLPRTIRYQEVGHSWTLLIKWLRSH